VKPPAWLSSNLQIQADCIEQATAAKEKGKRFELVAPSGSQVFKVKVDGCWIKSEQTQKVDYMFCCVLHNQPVTQDVILVELKGRHYGEALEQMKATLAKLQPYLSAIKPRQLIGCIVLSNGNEVGNYQTEALRIRKRYGIVLQHKSKELKLCIAA